MPDLGISIDLHRGQVLDAVARATVTRLVGGPGAARQEFRASIAAIRGADPALDAASELYIVLGAFILAIGTADETAAASAAAALDAAADSFAGGPGVPFGCALIAACGIARGEEPAEQLLQRLDRIGEGRWLPAAWAALVRSRRSAGSTRARHLLEAAAVLDRLGRRLEAAERMLDAAEADRASVDVQRLDEVLALCSDAGAAWLAGRARTLIGGSPPAPIDRQVPGDLTRRELEVAELAASGLSNREIASRLYVSVRTVTSHLDHIYTKLSISSRAQLRERMKGSLDRCVP
jgi:DNA-binding CsgD family transcriptional regulator